jgi:hypothetical protein
MSLHRCIISGEGGVLCDTHLYEVSNFVSQSTDPLDRIYSIQASLPGDVCEQCEV